MYGQKSNNRSLNIVCIHVHKLYLSASMRMLPDMYYLTQCLVCVTVCLLLIVPVGEPLNCSNTTFLPRNTSLTWQPPVRALQNGMIQGYYLNCTNSTGGVVSGTELTQTSSDTMFIIPVLIPFTDYTCQLASINEVGEGPSTICQFMTAQDSKSY